MASNPSVAITAMTEIDLNDGQLSGSASNIELQQDHLSPGGASNDVALNGLQAVASDATSISSESEQSNLVPPAVPTDLTATKSCAELPAEDSANTASHSIDFDEENANANRVGSDTVKDSQPPSIEAARQKDIEQQSISSGHSQHDSEIAANIIDDLRETRILELTSLCERQAKEISELRTRIEQQDAESRRYVAKLNEEHKKRVDQMNRLYEECRSEKDGMVVKYAQAEQRCIEAQRNAERVEQRVRDAQRNASTHEQRFRQIQATQARLQGQYDARCNEVQTLRSELERSRETVMNTSNQLKWTQMKLKEEQDLHTVCKQRLENAQKAIATLREEATLLKQKYDDVRTQMDELVATAKQQQQNREAEELAKHEQSESAAVKAESPTRAASEPRSTDLTPASTQAQSPSDVASTETDASDKAGAVVSNNEVKKPTNLKESPVRHNAGAEAVNVSSILLKEVDSLKRTVTTLRDENAKLREFESRNETLRRENEKLTRRISELEAEVRRCEGEITELLHRCEAESSKHNETIAQLRATSDARDELRERVDELEAERVELNEKQSELLSSVERATGCATNLSARNAELSARLESALSEAKRETERCRLAESRAIEERTSLEREVGVLREQLLASSTDLDRTRNELETLRKSHEDVVDTYSATRRKLEANLKDVTKQLERLKRQVDTLESAGGKNATQPTASASTATATRRSNGDLKAVLSAKRSDQFDSESASWTNARTFDVEVEHIMRSPRRSKKVDGGDMPTVGIVDAQSVDTSPKSLPERAALVNKIVRLQNLHAAKIEKIEFYKDHVRQLNEEIQKKSRIIQYYVLREEGGRLSNASSIPVDPKKAQLAAKRPGLLTQLYSQATGAAANQPEILHLGEVNAKLQAILEDTLVKNMTLKESLDQLSQEVARLTHENNELKSLLEKSDAFIRDRVTNLNLTTFDGGAGQNMSRTSAKPSAGAQQPGGHASQRKSVGPGAQTQLAANPGSRGAYSRSQLHASGTE